MIALSTGFVLVAFLGIGHHFALLLLRHAAGDPRSHPNRSMMMVFVGLLAIHTAEILIFAAVYAGLMEAGWFGGLGGEFGDRWEGLVYFSGINFVTLGYTQIETEGAIRLVSIMQSLGGFMVLTWSATFIYSVWREALPPRD